MSVRWSVGPLVGRSVGPSVRRPPSVIHCPLSTVCCPSSVVRRLLSVVHPPSVCQFISS
jgi:hypothetical protein